MNMTAAARPRIVLAYTGDLDTSVAIPWLAESRAAEVVALTLDLGQTRDLEEIRDRALALGALRAHVLDVREEFARDYLLPALKAGAIESARRAVVVGLADAIIASKLVEIAGIEHASEVAHGAGVNAPRIAAAVHGVKPGLVVTAPVCEWGFGRAEVIDYATARRLPIPASVVDQVGRAGRMGEASAPVERSSPSADEAAVVDITFKAGTPVAINGVSMPLLDLIGSLDFIAGKNGIGRPGRIETAAPAILSAAHHHLRARAATDDVNEFSNTVGARYATLVERGAWFSVLRRALDAYVDRAEQSVNGNVRVKLFHGSQEIVDSKVLDSQEHDDYALVRPLRYRA
jgi:argininosuccinate synthase